MPDLFEVLLKKVKFIFGFTLLAVIISLIIVLLAPKKYLSETTALPANSAVADKARLFNSNIEVLYSDFGSPDDLDKMEGTALLDTIFIATAKENNLPRHYSIGTSDNELYKAAMKLKKNSIISKTGYGELRVKVWDKDRTMAAQLANRLMQQIQEIHQHLQNTSKLLIIQQLREDHAIKEEAYKRFADTNNINAKGGEADIKQLKKTALLEQLLQEEKIINQYQLAIRTNPSVLLIVETARPSLVPDKPRILSTLLFTLFGAFGFAYLLALLMDRRKPVL